MSEVAPRPALLQRIEQENLLPEERVAELADRLSGDWRPPVQLLLQETELSEVDLLPVLAELLDIDYAEDLSDIPLPDEFFEQVPPDYARQTGVVATSMTDGRMELAVAPDTDMGLLAAELSRLFHRTPACFLAPRQEIEAAIDRSLRERPDYLEHTASELSEEDISESVAQIEQVTDFGKLMRKTPVVKLVSLLIAQAVRMGSTDIHVQPVEDHVRIRFRTDGVLHEVLQLPRSARDSIISRIKVLGKMDIAERRAPQDGRASFQYEDREIDVRISVVPTSQGERAVLRLLDKSERVFALDELGLDRENRKRLDGLIHASHGMILATGPTGSGKTTTLYAALNRINSPEVNTLTIEDPVEYQLEGISQIQVQRQKNVTFGSMLRSIVRQDPDVIMVGEIRDAETAAMAVQSALTGHLMFSTLHTNDAPGAVARLLDLEVEPFLLSSALLAVLAQRLVRRICPECGQPTTVPESKLRLLGLEPGQTEDATFREGEGCDRCLGGYRGRTGIFELLTVNDSIRHLISQRESSAVIRQQALEDGMRTLLSDGALKAMQGRTTVDEVLRVAQRNPESDATL